MNLSEEVFPTGTVAEILTELKRRQSHEIHQYNPGDIPGWDQLSFHKSTDRYRLVFGGNQSGKSYSNAYEVACWLTGKHPHRIVPDPPVTVWVISAEYSTIHQGVYRHLINLIPPWEIEKFGPQVPQQPICSFIRLKNGSEVYFKTALGDARKKFQAAAVHLTSIDEEVDYRIWEELEVRSLATGGEYIISATLVESYEWIVELEKLAEESHEGYFITRLDTEFNPHLDKKRVKELKEKFDHETLEVRFKGKSRRSRGLIYNTWKSISDSTSEGHIIKDFPVPYEWPKWCAIDPGIQTFAVLWITIDPYDFAYGYREFYFHNAPLWEVAATIRAAEGYQLNQQLTEKFAHYVWENPEGNPVEHIVMRVIDDKVGSRLITGDEGVLSQLYEIYGISCIPAIKSVRPGIETCRKWLEPVLHPKTNILTPRFRIFESCENFIKERLKYRIRDDKRVKKDANDPIDQPIKRADHLMDCWRYIAMTNPKYKDRQLIQAFQEGPKWNHDRHKREKETAYADDILGTEY